MAQHTEFPTPSDRVVAIGNFNGANADEIVIQSNSALGIIKFGRSGPWQAARIHPVNTWLGQWYFRKENAILAVGQFEGGQKDLVIAVPLSQ
jgi:hypothetical protein